MSFEKSSELKSSRRGSLRKSLASAASFPEFPVYDDEHEEAEATRLVNTSRRASSVGHEFAAALPLSDGDNSVSVITSLWSTMMGSTVLVMPRMFRDAGLIASSVGLVFMMLLCAYTAVTITRLGRIHGMTTKEVVGTLPPVPRLLTFIAAIMILLGAGTLFHVYIVECLMGLIGLEVEDTKWRVIIAISTGTLVFLMTIPRSLKILFMASSYGIVIIGFCLVFVVIKSIMEFRTGSCDKPLAEEYGMTAHGFGPVANLLSTLTLSFYSHSFVLALVSQATRISKVPRNVFISYICAGLSYGVPAAIATVAFKNCGTFAKDFVLMFDDPYADAARLAIILLVMIVYPIVVSIARGQFIEAVFGMDPMDASWPRHITVALVMTAGATVVPCVNAGPTTIAATTGILGTYWALIFPCVAYLHTRRKQEGSAVPKSLYIGHGLIILLAVALMLTTVLSIAGLIEGPPDPKLLVVPGGNHTAVANATTTTPTPAALTTTPVPAHTTPHPPATTQRFG